jgi:hypothetical protein
MSMKLKDAYTPRTGGVLRSGYGCTLFQNSQAKRIIEMLSHGGMERIENVVDYFEDLL